MTPPSRTRSTVNRGLAALTGYELRRSQRLTDRVPTASPTGWTAEQIPLPPDRGELARTIETPVDRLVAAPTFILSSVRSGSTLLRLILNSHPEICSPHELHLRRIGTQMTGSGRYALGELGIDDRALRNLLWDRIVHRELVRSGKSRYVNKTPNDALIWFDILACWPDAQFIFLHRHPAAIVASWSTALNGAVPDELVAQDVLAYATGMEQARAAHGGLVMRYEDLIADPAAQTRRICAFLGLEWDATMLDYRAAEHAGLRRGLGDWSVKLQSGSVQSSDETPDDDAIPASLLDVARAWGYLPASVASQHRPICGDVVTGARA